MKKTPKFSPNSPCKQDCPDRTAECRRTCERYKAYEAKKLEEYKERGIERELDDAFQDMHRRRTKEGCFLGSQAKHTRY
jgi:hypothetical protein